jgi:guanylate kinase
VSRCSTSNSLACEAGRTGTAERVGRIVVLSGPAGVGKTTVAERLCRETGLRRSVSATTRAPRAGEVEGRDYLFLTEADFRQRLARGEFLEHASVHGHLYGTPRAPIVEALRAGEDRLLVIDVQGAMQVKQSCPDALLIFLDAPDADVGERLAGRGSEDPYERRKRRAVAPAERTFKEHYDYCVVNDTVDRAVAELRTILSQGGKPEDRRHRLDG